jgi:DNA-binding MarR family transcriptional regulator
MPQVEIEAERALAVAGELRVVVGKLIRKLRDQGPQQQDMSWSQIAALKRLENDGPMTVTQLAKAEGVRPQSMGATVAALQAAGLMSGEPHPTDGRQTILSLTPAFRKWIKAGRAAREDWLSRAIESRLSPAEQAKLAASVDLLKRLVD